jgi:hypothetical protein
VVKGSAKLGEGGSAEKHGQWALFRRRYLVIALHGLKSPLKSLPHVAAWTPGSRAILSFARHHSEFLLFSVHKLCFARFFQAPFYTTVACSSLALLQHYNMAEQTPESVIARVPSDERHFLVFIASHEERGRPWCR